MNETHDARWQSAASVQRRSFVLLGVAGGAALAALLAALAGPGHDEATEHIPSGLAPGASMVAVPDNTMEVDVDWRRIEDAPEHAAAAVAAYEH